MIHKEKFKNIEDYIINRNDFFKDWKKNSKVIFDEVHIYSKRKGRVWIHFGSEDFSDWSSVIKYSL
jgi:hypothetical protein